MLFFLSRKYFQSRNCLKEIRASLDQEKPLVLVHEQQEDKGGGPLDVLKAECRSDEMRDRIFHGRTPITWHRISHYQNHTLRLIATEMLRQGPRYDSDEQVLTLLLPGEVRVSELALPRPLVLWCSAGNPGSAEIAQELLTSMASDGAALQVVHSQPDMRELQADGASAFLLLYLNKETWVEHGNALENDVRASRAAGLKIVLVHENDTSKGGCEFGHFFATTPEELINDGLYKDIAIALHTPPHRAIGLAILAQAVGATSQAHRSKVDKLQKALHTTYLHHHHHHHQDMPSESDKARAVKEAKPMVAEATVVAATAEATDAGESVEVEIDVVPASELEQGVLMVEASAKARA